MSGSVNKVILVGNCGKEPEVKFLSNGKQLANLSIATSETWKDKSGQRQEKTEWHRVVCFNEHLCKIIEQYVHKGTKLYLEGQLQTRSWEESTGVKRYATEVVLQGFSSVLTLLDSRQEGPTDKAVGGAGIDDEIPF